MPRLISADVLDSTRDDWTITDDGDDRGPITSWPAPKLRHDDRTPALRPSDKLTRSGLPDAYAFLRMKDDPPAHRMLDDRPDPPPGTPFADAMGLMVPVPPDGNLRGVPQYRTVPKPPRMIDARYAGVDVYEAGMLIQRLFSGEARGFETGAGMLIRRFLSRADAGALDECGAVPTMPTSTVGRSSYRVVQNWLQKWAKGGRLPADQASKLTQALDRVVSGPNWNTFNDAKKASFEVLAATSDGSKDKVAQLERIWKNLEGGVPVERGFLGQVGQGIEGAVTGVAHGAVAIGQGIAKPVIALATSPAKLAADIAQGKNVFESLKDTVKRDFASVKEVAPYAQAVISFVPGIGAGVNAAIAAGAAIAQGQPITSALIAGVKNALPGGPIAAQAFDTAYQIARGENVGEAALQALVNQMPGGELGKQAAQAAIAVAKGQNLQQAALGVAKTALQGSGVELPGGKLATKLALDIAGGKSVKDVAIGAAQGELQKIAGSDVTKATTDILGGKSVQDVALGAVKDKAMVAFTEKLSPFAVSPMNATGPRILNTLKSETLPAMLPREVKLAAASFLQTPALRSLPIAEVARRLNVTADVARAGAASVLQSVQRAGGSKIPMLAHAPALEQKIPFHATFDQMMSTVSRAAPPAYSHNATTQRAGQLRQAASVFQALQAHGLGAGALDPKLMPTIRQGSTGDAVVAWQKIIGVTADGQFGPQTTAATKAFQQKKGLVADGIVGPQSWLAGLGSVITAPVTPGAPPSLPTSTPPPVTATPVLTGAMPIIKRGSTGAPVKTWQAFLGIAVDGIFGPDTEAKTRTYQAQNGLVADGIVGPNTWAKAMSGTGTAPPASPGGQGPVIATTPPITLPPIIPGTPPIVVPPVVITEPPPGSPPGTPPIITTTSPPGMPPFPTTSTPAKPPNPPGQPPAPPPITTSPPGMPPVVLPPSHPGGTTPTKPSMVPVMVGLGLLAFVMAGSRTKILKL